MLERILRIDYLKIKIGLFSIFGFLLIMTALRLYDINFAKKAMMEFNVIELGKEYDVQKVNALVHLKLKDNWIYREVHTRTWFEKQQIRANVDIYDHTGDRIGQKILNFETNAYAPTYRLLDYRDGNYESIKRVSKKVYLMEYKRNEKSKLKMKEAKAEYTPVVDAGFEHFIQDYWRDILESPQIISFAIPSKLAFISIKVTHIKSYIRDNSEITMMELKPQSFFLQIFVAPIRLIFNREKKLTEYLGPYSFFDNRGKGIRVRTEYIY